MTLRYVRWATVALLLIGVLTGCSTPPLLDSSKMSALQIRAIQSRAFDSSDSKATLKTVLNVLQDEGFLVDYGNADLGLLHGTKQIDELAVQRFGEAPAVFNHSYYSDGMIVKVVTIEATANISDYGERTKVRVNFQQKVTGLQGAVLSVSSIVDPKYYQEFFAKLERGLFIQKQGL